MKKLGKGALAASVSRRSFVALACTAALTATMAMGLVGCSSASDAGTGATGSAAAQSETRMFADSLGREVEVPAVLDKIAPSGHTAQQVLLTMAPDKMVGLSQELSPDQMKYFKADLSSLPVFGAAFGAKGDMNKEAVAAAGAQIVIDTGEPKDGLKDDLDALQEQLGIPVVFINTPIDDYGTAYTMLGDLLNMKDRGKQLADYCTKAYKETADVMAKIPEADRTKAAYLLGNNGLNAIAKGSYQGTIIDMCANNVVQVEKASGSGAGNEISLEQIAVWNPELIVFGGGALGGDSFYSMVGSDAAWSSIAAIQSGSFYQVPSEPWTWLNNPPTVNQVLGMQWFPRLCYPDKFNNDMKDVVTGYYKTFYDYDMSDAEYDDLMKTALPKTA